MSFGFSISQQPSPIFPATMKLELPQTLPADVLRHCLCHHCNCYANVAPVRFVNNQIACGRCLSPGDGVQLLIVEALMKMHNFPCRYEAQGCKAILQYSVVESHEKSCDYKKVTCTMDGCEWTGTKNGIQKHFEDRHMHQIIDSKVSIPINIKDVKNYNLLYMKKVPYLVRISCDGKSIIHSIKSFCTDLEALQISYDLKFSANFCDLTFNQQKIQSYDSNVDMINNAISVGLLSTVFGEVSSVDINIFVKASATENIETLNVSDVECPVCMEAMLGQIFIRKCGHSMCATCSGNLHDSPCPVCRSGLVGKDPFLFSHSSQQNNFKARNYSLEKIIRKVHNLI